MALCEVKAGDFLLLDPRLNHKINKFILRYSTCGLFFGKFLFTLFKFPFQFAILCREFFNGDPLEAAFFLVRWQIVLPSVILDPPAHGICCDTNILGNLGRGLFQKVLRLGHDLLQASLQRSRLSVCRLFAFQDEFDRLQLHFFIVMDSRHCFFLDSGMK